MTFATVLFYVLSVILVVAAFRVISAPNPVTGVLHLILAFFTASMLWVLAGAEFLGLLLVLVYVGAVMVLFLFVVMMLDMRMASLRTGLKVYLPLGLGIGLIMVLEMAFVIAKLWAGAGPQASVPADYNNTRALGTLMYTQYVFAVEVGAVILLLGMVSAIALTLRRRRDVKYNNPADQVRVRAKDRLRLVSIPSQTEPKAQPAASGESK
ncbi:MAG TPA: NADH-quinone oxidoreductase subunit J [Eoetvoesiella sp.]|uniref:NADH-quinone oxidoreductase subunit J n=1 Tax=Eoetvoesiella sp. TaxID=1966355 RepID=UPI002C35F3F9|nr:NADH-quinone oxidoreductase subunit J [Eoetvoesiella sp.]HWK61168.1 NADH-quinone oxidoreductase subunit J [Eoetvoesiella sp.]